MLPFFSTHKPRIAAALQTYLAHEHKRLKPISTRSARLAKDCYQVAIRGKMVRGGLACLGYAIAGKTIDETCYKIAAAVELAHTGLLIHDDIMDGDTLRRGQRALHTYYSAVGKKNRANDPARFGEATATCLGDMTFFWTLNLVAEALAHEPVILAQAITLLTKELAVVGAAQAQDVWSGNMPTPERLSTILSTYRHKTARYTFSLPLTLGTLVAGHTTETAEKLSRFGEHVGIVFQIRDDALGLFGSEKDIGKPIGSDIREGKKTLYHHFLYRKAQPFEQRKLDTLFGNPHITKKDIAFVRHLILHYGITSAVERIAGKELQQARVALEAAELPTEYHTLLSEIMAYATKRTS